MAIDKLCRSPSGLHVFDRLRIKLIAADRIQIAKLLLAADAIERTPCLLALTVRGRLLAAPFAGLPPPYKGAWWKFHIQIASVISWWREDDGFTQNMETKKLNSIKGSNGDGGSFKRMAKRKEIAEST